jgi:hypothetical protein
MLSCEGGAVVEFRAEKAENFRCRRMPNRPFILQQEFHPCFAGSRVWAESGGLKKGSSGL